jgi:hypothetical protein
VSCDDAVERILRNEIGLVKIYRSKDPIAWAPDDTMRVEIITLYPRSARTNDPTEPYPEQSALNVGPLIIPDRTCYPRIVAAVQQINAHPPRQQHVELQWLYLLSVLEGRRSA